MDFLIADGRERRHHHVKSIEPRPAFDVVKADHPDQRDQNNCGAYCAQISQDFQIPPSTGQISVVGASFGSQGQP